MIEVDHIKKNYGKFEALKDVTFSVSKGEILGFLGPNGAGKTTLMRILTGFFPPTTGRALINGKDVDSDLLSVQKVIGYLPENVPLYPEMRVRDYLGFIGQIKKIPKDELTKQIDEAIEKCGIEKVKQRQIKKLSKGYKQRVGLAQALLGNPEVLILDEPTTGLDPKQIIEIRELIKEMAGEKTIILSTHILPEVSALCDRVIIINEGVIIAEDSPQNLENKLQASLDCIIQLKGDPELAQQAIGKIPGVLQVRYKGSNGQNEFFVSADDSRDIRPDLMRVLAKDFDVLEFKTVRLSLEDIFVKLVTKE